jgi:Tol biopolymer transport system component
MGADGSGVTELPFPGTNTRSDPAWSPDGHRISFVVFAGQYQIHVARPDGSEHLALTSDQAPVPGYTGSISNRAPTFSPDGTKVAFTHIECPFYRDYSRLQVVNADGSGGRATVADNAAQEPDWQLVVGPQRGDYKNAAHFCKALREFLGDEAFRSRYGGGANAHGKCVSANH